MTEWMELTFCHFNDQRNLVEAWTKDPEIINKKVGTYFLLIVKLLYVDGEKVGDNSPSSSSSQQKGDG